uniref:WD repeat-containing protein 49-like n=1 Tax=Ciona intestinalis TaxID=7719 RepID=UPI000180D376|nr:WD repeat-containing protein 49-like [Ciona intestinalis]|eukprot:XP_018668447.1 WD repeat-containing protein 49-like [Ciona intestinalis]
MKAAQNGKLMSVGSSSSRSQVSKLTSITGDKLETKLSVKDLEELKVAFMPDSDYNGFPRRLDRKQFSDELSEIIKKGTKEEYMELFDKIDITKQGTVDWDMFVQFMLLEFYEKDEKVKTTQVPQWKELKMIVSPHKDCIQRIELVKATNKYLSISKEGCIVFWDQHVKMQRSIKLSWDSIKARDLWVTDFVLLPNVNKIAVSFTSKEIAFYDLSSKVDFNCQYKLQELTHTPLCMDYWTNPDDSNESILVFGDIGGKVTAMCFSSAQIALFDRPSQGSDGNQNNNTTVSVKMKDLIRDNSKHTNCRVVYHSAHVGWVRQVKYAEHLECFISCSTGTQNSVVIGFVEKASTIMRTTSFRYYHGVHCFDYHQQMNLIATGSVNHQVCLWNPYVISKPVGILTGHMAAVIQVIVNVNKSQLMSFSKDKVLRIWDIQQQICLQRLAGMFPKGPEVQTRLYFDEVRNRLFVTFNYLLTLLEMKIEIRDRVMSHERPVTCAIYNSLYNQVISACQAGTVTVWMIDNGQKVKQFTNCHGQAEITTLELDHSRTRLFTGSTDGTIKVWDFNGHCHHNLAAGRDQPADIAQIVMLKRSIATIGWEPFITVFRQGALTQFYVHPADWKGGKEHQDDILTAAYNPPSMLATGSYDGEIVIWNANSEGVSKKLQQRSRQKLGRRPMTTASTSTLDETSSLRPMTTDSQASELEFSFVISRLVFLKHRMAVRGNSHTGADLVSCGGGGWVRFWGVNKGSLLSEFVAHHHAGNVIANTDPEDKYLITADSDGAMKVWNIEEYLLQEPTETVYSPPPTLASWQAHSDCITSITICSRNDRLLIITSSSDCSVALWDFHGNRIGEFGQENHWTLSAFDPTLAEEEEDDEAKTQPDESLFKEFDMSELELESRASTAPDMRVVSSHSYDPDFRANTWGNTVLGKAYQEGRLNKRERKQPGTVPGFKDYIEESAVGPYGILGYRDLDSMPVMRKPDFMLHPHKYFGEKSAKGKKKTGRSEEQEVDSEKQLGIREARQSLKAAFDERTLFPKELLDFEAQIRTEHAQKLKHTARDVFRKTKPVSILKSFVTSGSNVTQTSTPGGTTGVGSKVGSRVGSSQHSRHPSYIRHRSSNNMNQPVDTSAA